MSTSTTTLASAFRFNGARTLEDLQSKVHQGLEEFSSKEEQIIAFDGSARELLHLIDQASLPLEYGLSSLIALHPDAAFREGAKDLLKQKDKATDAFWASRKLYQKLADVEEGELKPDEIDLKRRWLKTMVGNGAALNPEQREQFLELNVKMNSLRMSFEKNLAENDSSIKVSVDELDGLPDDFIAKRKGEDGMVTLTSRYPDVLPVRVWAHSADVRERIHRLAKDAGYPENEPIILEYLKLAHERAQLLGFKNAVDANFGTNYLVANEEDVRRLLDYILECTKKPASEVLEQQRAIVGDDLFDGKQLLPWNRGYAEDQALRKHFGGFDSKQLALYFPAKLVPGRFLSLCETRFQVQLVPRTDVGVWHPSVQVYDVWDMETDDNGSALIGRLYLDMGPREGKNRHASAGYLQRGLAGKILPEVRLLANVPDGDGDCLMLQDVQTLFHELGHCFHALLGSYKQPFFDWCGFSVENDVVEAPSTLLENWLQDPTVLRCIAIDAKGNIMPDKLMADIAATDAYARAGDARIQVNLALQALKYFAIEPAELQERGVAALDDVLRYTFDKERSDVSFVEGIHSYLNFSHLLSQGYGPGYWVYIQANAYATDLLWKFREAPGGVLDQNLCWRYRKEILEAGARRPFMASMKAFLGRDFAPETYVEHLTEYFDSKGADMA